MESSQEKSLPASERKLQKARDDGQGARSRDLSHFAILATGSLSVLAFAPWLIAHLQQALSEQLSFNATQVLAPDQMLLRLQSMVLMGLLASGVFALITSAAAIVSAVGAGGWIYSFEPITPQFNRLNPLTGFSNLFTKQQFANVGKMVLMTVVLSWVAWKYMGNSHEEMAMLIHQPSPMALRHVGNWLASGVGLLLLVVFIAAAVDVPLQAFFFKSRLKMSPEEVKQEHKEAEGSPQTKSRIRQRQREMADGASVKAVPKADFVVMNPTHYAVALKYDDKTMSAPQVIARGTDLIAFRIRELATDHEVPVLQAPMLARALYAHADLDQPIPAALYAAVAQVLAYVYRLKAALRGEGKMPDELVQPQVPPELDPLQGRPLPGGVA